MYVSVKTRVRPTSETVVDDTEVQHQTHRTRRVRKENEYHRTDVTSTQVRTRDLTLTKRATGRLRKLNSLKLQKSRVV
jgi:hypothetical protein